MAVKSRAAVRNRAGKSVSHTILGEIIVVIVGGRRLRILDGITDRNPHGLPIVASVMTTTVHVMNPAVTMTTLVSERFTRRLGRR
jgi:hypothetical protein